MKKTMQKVDKVLSSRTFRLVVTMWVSVNGLVMMILGSYPEAAGMFAMLTFIYVTKDYLRDIENEGIGKEQEPILKNFRLE